jgi:hypothetical protein
MWRTCLQVLRAICAGFTKNAEPAACMRVAVDDSCRDGSVGASTCALKCAAFPPPLLLGECRRRQRLCMQWWHIAIHEGAISCNSSQHGRTWVPS